MLKAKAFSICLKAKVDIEIKARKRKEERWKYNNLLVVDPKWVRSHV